MENLNLNELKFMHELLTTLDNPENMAYKDFFTMMCVKPYIKYIQGKNPNGENAFKFILNDEGQKTIKEIEVQINQLTK